MTMESGAEVSTAAIFQLAALSGNNGYRHYDMLGPDGHGLFVHNWTGNSTAGTTGVEGIAYTPATTGSQRISISRGNTDIVLMSTNGGRFTYPSTLGVTGASKGYFDSNGTWVNQGAVGYAGTSITLAAGQTVSLTRPNTGAVAGIRRQAEFATVGGGATVESSSLGFASNGYVNLPTTGGQVSFANVDGLTGGTPSLVIRFANGCTAARTVSVTLNGGANDSVRIRSTGPDRLSIGEVEMR